MPRKPAAVRTPGVPENPKPDQAEADDETLVSAAADLETPTLADVAAKGSPVAQALPADLQAFIRAEIAKGVAEGLRVAHKLASNPSTGAPLPDQSEIDRSRIVRPTLSKQGWVVPKDYGKAAAELVSKT